MRIFNTSIHLLNNHFKVNLEEFSLAQVSFPNLTHGTALTQY